MNRVDEIKLRNSLLKDIETMPVKEYIEVKGYYIDDEVIIDFDRLFKFTRSFPRVLILIDPNCPPREILSMIKSMIRRTKRSYTIWQGFDDDFPLE